MSIEQATTIDFIGIEKSTGDVVLTVSDHLDWEDSEGHVRLLQAKINSYLAFIESGEILERYPASKERRVVIGIISQYTPDANGKKFLASAKNAVEDAGIGFHFRLYSGTKPE